MIQRIQTIYLLIALALLIAFCFLPVAVLTYENGNVLSFKLFAQENLQMPLSGIPVFLSGYIAVWDMIIIFLYKKRKKQIQFCLINIILLVCLDLLVFYQVMYLKNAGVQVSYQIIFIFPLLCAVFTYLAIGRIKKDENLVRSYDRLR